MKINKKYSKIQVLVTDSEYKHSLGIVRSLGKLGINPYLLSFKKHSLSSYSKHSNDEIIINKNYTKDDLISKLLLLNIDLIILVGTDSFMKIVPWKKELLSNNITIITVDEKTQNIAFSKKDTYELANKIGVPTARTYYPKSLSDIDLMKNNVTYPCVIKGLYEVGGNIVDYAYSESELKSKYISICEKYNINEKLGLPMLQEYITGNGCAFFAVYNNGKCGLTFQHKRVREYPVSGGASVCAKSYKNKLVEEYGKKLLDSLSWHGVAMVEFKLNSKDIPILMEINPKFWGSTDLALEAGVNFPKALIDIHSKIDVPYSNEYKLPFKYHWPMQGDILHGVENTKAIIPIILDILNPKVKSNLWFSDIFPNFRMTLDFVKSIIIKIIRK
jgi:predicted ATP-grasp superfamily ATP-dependent carboligase